MSSSIIKDLKIILEHTGKTVPIIEIDASVTVGELLEALAKKVDQSDLANGFLTRKSNGKRLLKHQDLREAGIKDGEVLLASAREDISVDLSYLSSSDVNIAGGNIINIKVDSSTQAKRILEELRRGLIDYKIPPPPEEVLAFLEDMSEGALPRYEAKLIVVGEGGSGKSSLLRSLRNENFIQGLETTHGISVLPYQFSHPDEPQKTVTLHVWDFGGQQIYHTTHQFFMTQRSLYLLVWNARGDTEQARLDYWLRNIQVLAPDSPVILVATHVEERPLDFNFHRFKEAYPQIVGHVGVSNKFGTGIDKLKSIIVQETLSLELMGEKWPKTWRSTELILGKLDKYFLNHEKFVEICIENGVADPISQNTLGAYLHDLGKLIYFQDDDALADFIILKPNWLTRAISKVLDDTIIRDNYGVFYHNGFSRVWDVDENGLPYDRTVYPQFLRLMERFLISYRLDSVTSNISSQSSLIPLRLPHNPPPMESWEEVYPGQPEIKMVFRLRNFVPPGLMSWFIVLTHEYTQDLHWREGVRLIYEGNQAQVSLNPSKRELWLKVKGSAPKNLFNILQHTINKRILERFFSGLEYTREVPCICHQSESATSECGTYFQYEQLITRMKLKKLTIECEQPPYTSVSVPELLEGIHYTTNALVESKLDSIYLSLKSGQEKIGKQLESVEEELVQGFEHLKRDFNRLWNYEMTSINAECPNTFFIMPSGRWKFHPKQLFDKEYSLYLLCQYPRGPHSINNDEGYKISNSKEWFVKTAPWLRHLIKYLQYIPYGSIAKEIDQGLFEKLELSIAIYEAALKALPALEPSTKSQKFNDSRILAEDISVEGPALRALYSYLSEIDKEHFWAGLHKTPTNDGNIFWLCDTHRKMFKAT